MLEQEEKYIQVYKHSKKAITYTTLEWYPTIHLLPAGDWDEYPEGWWTAGCPALRFCLNTSAITACAWPFSPWISRVLTLGNWCFSETFPHGRWSPFSTALSSYWETSAESQRYDFFKLLCILFGIPICGDGNTDVGGRREILKSSATYRGGQGKAPAWWMMGQQADPRRDGAWDEAWLAAKASPLSAAIHNLKPR